MSKTKMSEQDEDEGARRNEAATIREQDADDEQ